MFNVQKKIIELINDDYEKITQRLNDLHNNKFDLKDFLDTFDTLLGLSKYFLKLIPDVDKALNQSNKILNSKFSIFLKHLLLLKTQTFTIFKIWT